jgi:hypothetical protein
VRADLPAAWAHLTLNLGFAVGLGAQDTWNSDNIGGLAHASEHGDPEAQLKMGMIRDVPRLVASAAASHEAAIVPKFAWARQLLDKGKLDGAQEAGAWWDPSQSGVILSVLPAPALHTHTGRDLERAVELVLQRFDPTTQIHTQLLGAVASFHEDLAKQAGSVRRKVWRSFP